MSVVYIVQMSQLFLLVLSKEANFIIRCTNHTLKNGGMKFVAYVPGKW